MPISVITDIQSLDFLDESRSTINTNFHNLQDAINDIALTPGIQGQGFTWKEAWSSTTTYNPYDVVGFDGVAYNCISTNVGFEPDLYPDRWATFASAADGVPGPTGPAGPGVTWQGIWNSTVVYNPYDLVQNAGSSYLCTIGNTNKEPQFNPSKWSLIAKKGDTGPAGPAGPPGPTGSGGNFIGPIASLPFLATTGASYTTTDSLYRFIGDSTPLWAATYKDQLVAVPPQSGWLALNWGGFFDGQNVDASLNFTSQFVKIPMPAGGGIRGVMQNAPGGAYSVELIIKRMIWAGRPGNAQALGQGIGFRESSTGKLVLLYFYDSGVTTGQGWLCENWSAPGSFVAGNSPWDNVGGFSQGDNLSGMAKMALREDFYLKLSNDLTKLNFYFSVDNINWIPFFGPGSFTSNTLAINGFFTSGPDQIVVVVRSDSVGDNSHEALTSVISYKVGP